MYQMVSLRQIEQFLAVAETMSFRRAAERLNMAQPPLTAAIRLIEETVGAVLIERTNRIVGLTAAGLAFRDEGRRTLAQAHRMLSIVRETASGQSGNLRVGFVASAVHSVVPDLVARFRALSPRVTLELQEAPTARQTAALLADQLDIGIVVSPLPVEASPRLSSLSIAEMPFVAALPTSNPLGDPEQGALDLGRLSFEDWVLFPRGEGPGLYGTIIQACAAAGFEPKVKQMAIQMDTILGLVAAGLGVALVPETLARHQRQGLAFRSLRGPGTPVMYRLACVWSPTNHNPAIANFIAAVQSSGPGPKQME